MGRRRCERDLPPSLECAYLFLEEECGLPSGGKCTIIDWIIQYARELVGQLTNVLARSHGIVTAMTSLRDGRLAIGMLRPSAVAVWDTLTDDTSFQFTAHVRGVTTLATLADGRLVSGSFDNSSRVGRALRWCHVYALSKWSPQEGVMPGNLCGW